MGDFVSEVEFDVMSGWPQAAGFDKARFLRRLDRVVSMIGRGTTPGERQAAFAAVERLVERARDGLRQLNQYERNEFVMLVNQQYGRATSYVDRGADADAFADVEEFGLGCEYDRLAIEADRLLAERSETSRLFDRRRYIALQQRIAEIESRMLHLQLNVYVSRYMHQHAGPF